MPRESLLAITTMILLPDTDIVLLPDLNKYANCDMSIRPLEVGIIYLERFDSHIQSMRCKLCKILQKLGKCESTS